MVKASLLLAGAGAAFVAAVPADLAERATCTFTDAASAIKGKTSCSTITLKDINVPAGVQLDLTGLKAGTKVVFQGKTTFGYKEWEGPLISVSGQNIQVSGAPGHVLDGDGARWWDGKGGNGGKKKPKFFKAAKLTGNSAISGLNIKNTPVHIFSINNSHGLTLDHITIDNSAGDAKGGHNTDAFDVGSSSDITISNSNVQNQDDCLAVNSGTNIKFLNNICSGGHGISIGSVGGRSDNVVKGVTVKDCTIKDSDNGVRIKTVSNAKGSVSNITYSNITLENIAKYGIVIQQDYQNGSPTGKPTGGVPITGVTLDQIHGNVKSSGVNVYILCAKGACSGWKTSGVKITGGTKKKTCSGIPSGSGISC